MTSFYLSDEAQAAREQSRASRAVLAQHEWVVLRTVAETGQWQFAERWKRHTFDWLCKHQLIRYNGERYVLTQKGQEALDAQS